MRKRVDFYSEILMAEEESQMDLEYWLDYTHQFGVSHKIPLYDHMSWFKYHNVEVWSLFALIIYIIYRILRFIISTICWCLCGCKKAKTDDKQKKE